MKNLVYLLSGLLFIMVVSNSQAQTLPKSGAALKASNNQVTMEVGKTQKIEINRLRAKSYTKAKFGSLKVNTPEGIEASIEADGSNSDLFYVSLAPTSTLTPGKYTLTIQGEGRNASKVKGTMISLTVGKEGSLAAQN